MVNKKRKDLRSTPTLQTTTSDVPFKYEPTMTSSSITTRNLPSTSEPTISSATVSSTTEPTFTLPNIATVSFPSISTISQLNLPTVSSTIPNISPATNKEDTSVDTTTTDMVTGKIRLPITSLFTTNYIILSRIINLINFLINYFQFLNYF